MKQGSTPTYRFKLPVAATLVSECLVVFAQGGYIVREFGTNECTVDGDEIAVTFTQDETLTFACGDDTSNRIEIEVQVLTTTGVCFRSAIITESCYRTLKAEELV